MNKDKISILDIKTAEQMFHYLNNHPNYFEISIEELEKVDKDILFYFIFFYCLKKTPLLFNWCI